MGLARNSMRGTAFIGLLTVMPNAIGLALLVTALCTFLATPPHIPAFAGSLGETSERFNVMATCWLQEYEILTTCGTGLTSHPYY